MSVRMNLAVVAIVVCGLTAAASIADAAAISVTAPNLLRGGTAVASNRLNADYTDSKAIDGLSEVSDWVGPAGAGNQILSVSGFNSAIETIRIWGNTDIPVYSVAISSSTTSQTSTSLASYETSLVTTTTYDSNMTGWTHNADYVNGSGDYYIDYNVNAQAGTKSLLFDFSNIGDRWVRIEEVQAFAPVPEPSSMVLAVLGIFGFAAYAWRKRK